MFRKELKWKSWRCGGVLWGWSLFKESLQEGLHWQVHSGLKTKVKAQGRRRRRSQEGQWNGRRGRGVTGQEEQDGGQNVLWVKDGMKRYRTQKGVLNR